MVLKSLGIFGVSGARRKKQNQHSVCAELLRDCAHRGPIAGVWSSIHSWRFKRISRKSAEQLLVWCASGESETLDFKRSTGECRDGVRALSATLNQRGGRVSFGVDSDGRAVGQNVSDRTLEDLSQRIQHIDPPVFPSVECGPTPNHLTVIAVTAAAGAANPYSHRGQAYQRVGNTKLTLSRNGQNRFLMERLHGERR